MSTCSKCGAGLRQHARFCTHCGTRVTGASPPSTTQPRAEPSPPKQVRKSPLKTRVGATKVTPNDSLEGALEGLMRGTGTQQRQPLRSSRQSPQQQQRLQPQRLRPSNRSSAGKRAKAVSPQHSAGSRRRASKQYGGGSPGVGGPAKRGMKRASGSKRMVGKHVGRVAGKHMGLKRVPGKYAGAKRMAGKHPGPKRVSGKQAHRFAGKQAAGSKRVSAQGARATSTDAECGDSGKVDVAAGSGAASPLVKQRSSAARLVSSAGDAARAAPRLRNLVADDVARPRSLQPTQGTATATNFRRTGSPTLTNARVKSLWKSLATAPSPAVQRKKGHLSARGLAAAKNRAIASPEPDTPDTPSAPSSVTSTSPPPLVSHSSPRGASPVPVSFTRPRGNGHTRIPDANPTRSRNRAEAAVRVDQRAMAEDTSFGLAVALVLLPAKDLYTPQQWRDVMRADGGKTTARLRRLKEEKDRTRVDERMRSSTDGSQAEPSSDAARRTQSIVGRKGSTVSSASEAKAPTTTGGSWRSGSTERKMSSSWSLPKASARSRREAREAAASQLSNASGEKSSLLGVGRSPALGQRKRTLERGFNADSTQPVECMCSMKGCGRTLITLTQATEHALPVTALTLCLSIPNPSRLMVLPRGLREVHLTAFPSCSSPYALMPKHLAALPRTIRTLRIHVSKRDMADAVPVQCVIGQLPSSVTTLKVHVEVGSLSVISLPSSLTKLSLISRDKASAAAEDATVIRLSRLKSLPNTLSEFSLYGVPDVSASTFASLIPPSLAILKLGAGWSASEIATIREACPVALLHVDGETQSKPERCSVRHSSMSRQSSQDHLMSRMQAQLQVMEEAAVEPLGVSRDPVESDLERDMDALLASLTPESVRQ